MPSVKESSRHKARRVEDAEDIVSQCVNLGMKYLFALPIAMNERLAWIHLQRRVQAGELPA
jgi:hypothetical protein